MARGCWSHACLWSALAKGIRLRSMQVCNDAKHRAVDAVPTVDAAPAWPPRPPTLPPFTPPHRHAHLLTASSPLRRRVLIRLVVAAPAEGGSTKGDEVILFENVILAGLEAYRIALGGVGGKGAVGRVLVHELELLLLEMDLCVAGRNLVVASKADVAFCDSANRPALLCRRRLKAYDFA
eukprot:CAMPEP_0183343386 /NCGR_PEP_ID=MMETSP0164_2-20130417/9314_1 /TAXON_ID=221442 /ORGANISM="Coccolithus pelagicus ssp braarudi, Strain PLY182g" /LENGTH=179 /DNA_ID=CAMNT_0025514197 /DNA_START=352 /DNA_END=892 /DNA_ORIENTATION=+